MAKIGDKAQIKFVPQYRGPLIPGKVYDGEVIAIWQKDDQPASMVKVTDEEGVQQFIHVDTQGNAQPDWELINNSVRVRTDQGTACMCCQDTFGYEDEFTRYDCNGHMVASDEQSLERNAQNPDYAPYVICIGCDEERIALNFPIESVCKKG